MKSKKIRILIIEDNLEFCKALKSLIAAGYSVMDCNEIADDLKAFEKIKRFMPHMIFLDFFMKGQYGFELIEKIRTVCPTAVIISMSCENGIEYEMAAIKRGANQHVSKSSLTLEIIDKLVKQFVLHTNQDPDPNRRKHTRYAAKEKISVKLVSGRREIWGKLLDISEGGLALCYSQSGCIIGDDSCLGIFPLNREFFIEDLHFKTVSDLEVKDLQANGSKNLIRRGVQFQNLVALQKDDLNYFIENFSQGFA